eukprot:IDg9901t1
MYLTRYEDHHGCLVCKPIATFERCISSTAKKSNSSRIYPAVNLIASRRLPIALPRLQQYSLSSLTSHAMSATKQKSNSLNSGNTGQTQAQCAMGCTPSKNFVHASLPALPGTLGEWEDLESPTRGLSMFNETDYAFDTKENERMHALRVVRLDHDGSIRDYSPHFEDALAKLVSFGGGTLQLGPGEFLHSRPIELPSRCCLRGAGMDLTTVKVMDNAPEFAKAGAIRTRYTRNVSVLDLTQDGNRTRVWPGYGRYGIYTHCSLFVWMRNVRVRNNHTYAFDPHGSKDRWGYYLVIEDCQSERNGLDGFTIDQYFYVSVLRCVGEWNDRHGINIITGSRVVLVKDCVFRANGGASGNGFGMVAQNNDTRGKFGTRSCRFVSNKVENCFRGAVCLRDVSDITVKNNNFEHYNCARDFVVYEMNQTKKVIIRENTVAGNAPREVKSSNNAEYNLR